jgi:hypothetical protein
VSRRSKIAGKKKDAKHRSMAGFLLSPSPLLCLLPFLLLSMHTITMAASATSRPQHILPLHHPDAFAVHTHDRDTPVATLAEGHARFAHRSSARGLEGGHSELDYDVIVAANTVRLSTLAMLVGATCFPNEVLLRLNTSLAGRPGKGASRPSDVETLSTARFIVEDPGVCVSSGIPENEPTYRRVLRVDGLDDVDDALMAAAGAPEGEQAQREGEWCSVFLFLILMSPCPRHEDFSRTRLCV